jgi:hypothetical protein
MRKLAAVFLLLAAACATGGKRGESDSPSIVGNYLLTRIDNRSLPTYSPTEPNVTVQAGSLVLGRAGAFSLTLLARNSPQMPPMERSFRGSYEASGDSILTVTPVDAPGSPIVYRVVRAGVQLRLRDPQGHRYEFTIR